MYSKEEAMIESIKYFNGDDLAANVFIEKYALRNKNNELIENNPSQMHSRISREFARIEKNKFKNPLSEKEIFSYLDRFRYIVPAGSPMFGIGNEYQTISLSNCYFLDIPYDSYASILKTDEQIVNICKRRGGIGICIDKLRPNGSRTNNAAMTSTGIIPFMERYSNSIREVGQQNRRGAGICILSIHHPQILDFVTVKRDLTKITGMNISVKLTNEFLNALEKDEEYELRFPVDSEEPKISQKISARLVWDTIIESAWSMGEPGLLFWDNITENTPADCYEEYASKGCNPCSELNLSILDSCRLMAMNLYSYVVNPFTKEAVFDFDKFKNHVKVAQRLMDDLVDLESEKIEKIINKIQNDPEPFHIKRDEIDTWIKIKKHNDEGRRTGLGITAMADTLAALNLQYGSDKGIEMAENIVKELKLAAYEESVEMAKELGSFSCYDYKSEENHPFIKRISEENHNLYEKMKKYGRRNISLTTIAPTGSLSIMTQTSSGIEPVFQISYIRRRKLTESENQVDFVDQNGDKWQEYKVFHRKFENWKDITGKEKFEESPWFSALAPDIDWENRIELQGKVQQHICHSISSTVNLPKNISKEVVSNIYTNAWKHGIKGITVYRDGSRTGVLINNSDTLTTQAKKRPKEVNCEIYHTNVTKKLDKVRHFKYLVMIGIIDGSPYEIFAIENGKYKYTSGKVVRQKRGCYDLIFNDGEVIKDITKDTTENEDALTRLVSISLRHNVPLQFIIDQLLKVEGEMFCFAKSLARALKKYIKDGSISSENCEKCGVKLIFENGCHVCPNCGNSRCN